MSILGLIKLDIRRADELSRRWCMDVSDIELRL